MVEEQDSWQDPLLLTDVLSCQEQRHPYNNYHKPPPIFSHLQPLHFDSCRLIDTLGVDHSSKIAQMEPPNTHLDAVNDIFRQEPSWESAKMDEADQNSPATGRCWLGFSLTSPDLVTCIGSNEMDNNENEDVFELRKNRVASIELSLDNGIDGKNEEEVWHDMPNQIDFPNDFVDFSNRICPVISINAGGINKGVPCSEVDFLEDNFYSGGDIIETTTNIGDEEECLELYQTARCGNFSYKFDELEEGNYIVDLHFAEIIFIKGPPGMRVFDIFVQEEKVVSCMDIYSHVGSNKPLILSDLRACVNGKDGLSITFKGVNGKPLVCGISVRKDSQEEFEEGLFHRDIKNSQMEGEQEPLEMNLQRDNEMQFNELTETKRALECIKMEYELKSKECNKAWRSLRELQNELMRKSMHVGSLAYAIEGQVKEKSRWFLCLRDLTKKLKMLKREHKTLSEEALEYKKCIEDVAQMTTMIQSAISEKVALEKENVNLKLKFTEGAKERKELYNKILELKGNIRVFCRCRPLNTDEISAGASMAIDFESAKDGELTVKSNGTSKKVFKFDCVFGPQANQAAVFEDTAPLVTSVLDGYNVCIFAYGQTGTGKTFTMEGTEEARGVNYRTLEELFRVVRERRGMYNYEMSVSVLEVYNEQIRNLLVPGSQPPVNSKRLEIRQVADGVHHVPGLVEAHVNNMNEVWEVLQTGSHARAVGATNANEHSSRSHCIHCLMVKGENLMNGELTKSKLWLVDLAGSERVAKTDVQGDRLKETQNINRSLSALGDVISALATKSPHIPFRNSKLTHLLQDSLGGDSKTLMFVQVSPHENDMSETLCSLNFASRVRGIELGPAKKQLDSSELIRYKQMVEKGKQDTKIKEGYIKTLEDTIYGLESKAKIRDLSNKTLQDKVKELESQLLIERKLARQHVDNKIVELQHEQQQQKQLQEDEVSLVRPLGEKNSFRPSLPPPTTDGFVKYNFSEKENKPERNGRLSMCPQRTYEAPICRRNSLIPLPALGRLAATPLTDPIKDVIEEDEVNNLEKTPPCSGRGHKTGGKKFNNILRRSLQKKVQVKSPMQQQQQHRRGGVGNGGMEKVRTSIGSRGRLVQREKRGKELLNQKEREKRGWNF